MTSTFGQIIGSLPARVLQLGGKVNFSVYPGRFNSKRSVVRQ